MGIVHGQNDGCFLKTMNVLVFVFLLIVALVALVFLFA